MEKMKKKEVTIAVMLIVALVATMGFATCTSAEKTRSIKVDGGTLLIDETGGISCSADAGSYTGSYVSGLSYKIEVDCRYIDTDDVLLGSAYFELRDPNDEIDYKRIYDWPGDNSWTGEVSLVFTPDGPGEYHWRISCSKSGDSDYDIGDLILT
ncbi:hypothetical protein ES705_36450 [subsurface metagenome]